MKKRKFSFWLSMGALCLCLATLVIGVYSAKTAHLTTNGTVSFKAHDCKVAVVGTISNAMRSENLNYAVVSDKTYTGQGESSDQTWKDKFDKGTEEDGTTLKTISETDTWAFGDIYFDDMNIGNDEEIKSIIITLQISNYSAFPVKASFTMPSLDANLSTEGSVNEVFLNKMSSNTPTTSSLVLKMTVTDKTKDVPLQSLEIDVNFEKSTIANASDYGVLRNSYIGGGVSGNILTIDKAISPNSEGNVVIPSKMMNNSGEMVSIQKVELNTSCPYKIIVSEGIKWVGVSSNVNVLTVELPTTFETSNSSVGSIYEIYNKSTASITTSGTNTIAIHTDMNESSVLKTTGDGIVYYPNIADSKSYILGLKKSGGSINLPQTLEDLTCELKGQPFYEYDGNIFVDNNTYGSNGTVIYKKSDNTPIWVSSQDTITIPNNITSFSSSIIPKSVTTIAVEDGNDKYAVNTEGTMLYDKTNYSSIWLSTSSTKTTFTVPEGFISLPNVSSMKFTSLNIPSTLTSITLSYIPSTTTTIEVASGNNTYKSLNDCLFTTTSKLIWCPNATYSFNSDSETITNDFFSNSNAKNVIINSNIVIPKTTSSYINGKETYTAGPLCNVQVAIVEVANDSLTSGGALSFSTITEVDNHGTYTYYRSGCSTVYVKEGVSLDLSSGYTQQTTSDKLGYIKWTINTTD